VGWKALDSYDLSLLPILTWSLRQKYSLQLPPSPWSKGSGDWLLSCGCVCACVCVCRFIYGRVYMCAFCVCLCVCVGVWGVCIQYGVCVCVCVCVFVGVCVFFTCTSVCVHMCMHVPCAHVYLL